MKTLEVNLVGNDLITQPLCPISYQYLYYQLKYFEVPAVGAKNQGVPIVFNEKLRAKIVPPTRRCLQLRGN